MGTPVSGASARQHSCIERSTTWPRPVRRTPRRPSMAALNANSDVTWAANCTGVAAATGGRSGKPNVNARPGRRPRHQVGALPSLPRPGQAERADGDDHLAVVGRHGLAERGIDVGDHHVGRRQRRARTRRCPASATTERLPWAKNAHHSDASGPSWPGANGGRWRRTWPPGGSSTTTSAPSRRPHPGGVRAGQPGQLDDAHARPRPGRHGAVRCTAEDLGVVDVRPAQRHVGLRRGERRPARRCRASTSAADMPAPAREHLDGVLAHRRPGPPPMPRRVAVAGSGGR